LGLKSIFHNRRIFEFHSSKCSQTPQVYEHVLHANSLKDFEGKINETNPEK
jgi:hypothetical protein